MKNKYFFISYEKEKEDSLLLINQIVQSSWITKDTTIINCSPDYSSRFTQLLTHKLSYLNGNETFEVINLEMPYPIMSQVWDNQEKQFIQFDKYLYDWMRNNISKTGHYLFVDSGTLRGKNFTKVKQAIKGKVESDNYKFASLYLQSDSIFTPDFYVQRFDKDLHGGLLFEWENVNNPNWDF